MTTSRPLLSSRDIALHRPRLTEGRILDGSGRPARSDHRRHRAKSWHDIYEAADRRDFKGYFYIPSLQPSEQLTQLSLAALRERSVYLLKNVPATTMLIDRLSLAEAGTGIWPKWTTGQEDYDKAATDAYHYANHDPRVFSADGQQDAYAMTYAIRRSIRLYGDCFGQLIRPAEGRMFPQVSLIPGYQCDNSGEEPFDSGWTNGIRTDELGRPLQYKFITGKSGEEKKERIVSADDILHFHDPFLPGEVRGEPCLSAVAKKMFRREDIAKALANGTLARERLGFALEFPDEDDGGGPSIADDADTEEVERTDGTKWTLTRLFGDDRQDQIEVPRLPKGAKIATIESNRPGTAVQQFQDSILREAAWNQAYPADWVFFLATGQGTMGRVMLEQVSEVINGKREFQLRPQFCSRHPVFFIWQLIKAGYFEKRGIKVPENWWQHKSIMPRLPSVDKGREGRVDDGRVATGLMSPEEYHGAQGQDAADVEDECVAAAMRRLRKAKEATDKARADGLIGPDEKITVNDIWARNTNVPVTLGEPEEPGTPPPQPPQE